ncbi:MAG TPA: DUF1232 domain-containing protein [Sedimentibacter sp.]|jgi:uncharacterized membrane protein YkvA (DUF1232 family)|nr:DUF1232 domain-containing protein [Sedimentibacter sp.]HOK49335.1 DUF1232 domain-containing protein [Sedimentibacter sp.]HOW23326.1 DUF1232 domain-containing protein [Sedimentibacter sp.]HRC80819.1 DUF1232 domain-containing protein [Sedimentibacter sp.]
MGRFLLIFKFLFDKNIPLKEKWWVIIPLIYILSPADLIPAPILGFGILDDLVMLSFLLTVIYDKTKKYYFDNKIKNKDVKDIIENVEYEIHKDEEE